MPDAAALISAAPHGAAYPQQGQRDQHLVDLRVLERLEEHVGSRAVTYRFVDDYLALWEHRRRRLDVAVLNDDVPAALDAVISIRTSSAMVGGTRLAGLAEKLQSKIEADGCEGGKALLAGIAACGGATMAELRLRYALKAG